MSQDNKQLQKYDIIKELGHGGMGRVYQAKDTVDDKIVAIKKLTSRLVVSPKAVLLMRNEFRTMTQLSHPNAVQVYDYGIDEDVPYYVMEYIEGQDLNDVDNPSVEQIVDVLIQLCQVLSYFHSRNLVHRDLKPGNVKVLADGSIKVIDYGLMTQLGVPASGRITGTCEYLAPEAISGGIIDERTDLYALGILAYEMLTGKLPFTGTRLEVLRSQLKTMPAPPRSIKAAIPETLSDIVMKLLAKDPEERYRDGASVIEDMAHLTTRERSVETTTQQQSYLYSSRMIGRDEELALGTKLLEDGKGALLVGAPGGVGKTRYMLTIRTQALIENWRSVKVDVHGTAHFLYGWVRQLYRQLEGLSSDELTKKHGEVFSKLGKCADGEVTGALVSWIRELGKEGKLVVFSDDMQWADGKSLQIFNELVRQLNKEPIIFVTAFRNNEVGPTSPLWQTTEEGVSQYLELGPLTKQQTGDLMEHLLFPSKPSDDFLEQSFKASGGNAFDLIEFLRYLVATGNLTRSGRKWEEPVSLSTLDLPAEQSERVIARICKLGEASRKLASAASVLGEQLDLARWQTVTGVDESALFDGIADLLKNQVMVKVEGTYDFAHFKLSETIYDNVETENRAKLHGLVADAICSDDEKGLLPVIARHYVAAGIKDKAVTYSLDAAREAEGTQAEWAAFDHYREAAKILEKEENKETELIEIYEKAAAFNSAAWIDAPTSFSWLSSAIGYHLKKGNPDKVFGLSLSHIVAAAISSNYSVAREKIDEVVKANDIKEGTLTWAILFGAGVCLVDWYEGKLHDCFDHAVKAINLFEENLEEMPADMWGAYAWSLFWRDKARAYLGEPVVMQNIQRIRELTMEGKSDLTIYWHTLTAVGARAAFSGRFCDVQLWMDEAARLSRKMGRVYWFECWISHSYLYAALHRGEYAQIEHHIERVAASPDPYQVRLAHLFRGRWDLVNERYEGAIDHLNKFIELEQKSLDNSYLEGLIYLADAQLQKGDGDKALETIEKGKKVASGELFGTPLHLMQFLHLEAKHKVSLGKNAEAIEILADCVERAKKLDNPIQEAFALTTMGGLQRDDDKDEARTNLSKARSIFLALNNKHQAGVVANLLEPLSKVEVKEEETPDSVKMMRTTEVETADAITLFDEVFEAEEEKPDERRDTEDDSL